MIYGFPLIMSLVVSTMFRATSGTHAGRAFRQVSGILLFHPIGRSGSPGVRARGGNHRVPYWLLRGRTA